MRRLLVRILSAVVVFLFIFLVILMLSGAPRPRSDDTTTDSVSEEVPGAETDETLIWLGREITSRDDMVATLVLVVLVAGFADTIGHVVILFANRVKPNRFAVTILANTILFLVGYFIWVGMVALVSTVVFDQGAAFAPAAIAVGLSYTPLIYGFLIALPYIGVLISNILHLLVAVFLIQLLQFFFPFDLTQAIVCAALSFAAVLAFRLTIGRPIDWITGKLLNAVAGTTMKDDVGDALDFVMSKGG